MEAKKQIETLLEANGATLKRGRKHLVYTLPNGREFTLPRTPSDFRAYPNALSELKKQLGVNKPPVAQPVEATPAPEHRRSHPVPAYLPAKPAVTEHHQREEISVQTFIATEPAIYRPATVQTAHTPTPQPTTSHTFNERLQLRIQQEAQTYERLMAEAQLAEKRKNYLEKLAHEGIEDQGLEAVLKSVLPTPVPVPQPPPPTPDPPTEHVPVTREILRATVRQFSPHSFSSVEVAEKLIGTRVVDAMERRRVQQAISQGLATLEQRDGVIKNIERAIGRRPSTWENVEPSQQ